MWYQNFPLQSLPRTKNIQGEKELTLHFNCSLSYRSPVRFTELYILFLTSFSVLYLNKKAFHELCYTELVTCIGLLFSKGMMLYTQLLPLNDQLHLTLSKKIYTYLHKSPQALANWRSWTVLTARSGLTVDFS